MRMRNWHITWFLNKHLSWVLKRTVSPFRWDGSFEHPKHMFELESHAKHSFVSKLEIWQLSVFTCRCQLRGTSHVSGSPVFFFWMHVGHARIQRGSNFDNVFYFLFFFQFEGRKDSNTIISGPLKCRLLITFANRLEPDQAGQKVGPELYPNCLTLWC